MSVDIGNKTVYGVVIETNQYAGNFEREMTAFCTGEIGECGVGQNLVPLYMDDMKLKERNTVMDPFWECIDLVADDRGCLRPCSIYRVNDEYNSVIIFFRQEQPPTPHQVGLISQRAKVFVVDPLVIERVTTMHRLNTIHILDVFVIKIATTVTKYNPL